MFTLSKVIAWMHAYLSGMECYESVSCVFNVR